MRKNMRRRFVMYFFIMMLTATLLSTVFSYLMIVTRVERQMKDNQTQLAQEIISFAAESGTPLFSNDNLYEAYSIHRLEDHNPFVVKNREALDRGEIVVDDRWLIPNVSTIFRLGDYYYQISLFPDASFFRQIVISLFSAVIAAMVFGVIIASFGGARFLKPIRALCAATEEVAKGNFSVEVPKASDAEMGRLVSNFNRMTRDLASMEKIQSEFTGNLSHELKTPLASIKGFADLLQHEELTDEERREYAAIISHESARLSALSANILRLTKLENAGFQLSTEDFSLDEQLRRVIALTAPQWDEKHLDMQVELEAAEISGDASLLQEVWVNLLSNAIKYTPDGGTVAVRLAGSLDSVIVEVEDNGIGMDDETARRVFERFFQGDRSHSGDGSGLGLSLAHRVVQLHHGDIEVRSIPGDGSLFRVTLPREQ